jgi:small subunit ribosomal protein S6
VNHWGRKRFAYPIEARNNGYYVSIQFTGAGEIVQKLERMYQLEENILRYLTIRLESKALKAREKSAERERQAAQALLEEAEEELSFLDEDTEASPEEDETAV